MRRKFLIIHNRKAGRLKTPLASKVQSRLVERGAEVALVIANSAEENAEIALKADLGGNVDAVVASGGDSTIRGVAKGLMGTKMPLGIIPAGTGNVLAKEIGLSQSPEHIADTLINGDAKPIKAGLANGELFLLMAGVGFDAEVVKHLNHNLKQLIRKAAYGWPMIAAILKKPPELQVSFDNNETGTVEAAWVVVTRARHYGGAFIIAPDASLMADEFQVVMITDKRRLGLIKALWGLVRGKNVRQDEQAAISDGVIIRSSSKVRIVSGDPVAAQIDGEWSGATPLELSVAAEELNLILPTRKE